MLFIFVVLLSFCDSEKGGVFYLEFCFTFIGVWTLADHGVASGTCCEHLEVSVTTAHASKTQHKKRKTPSDGIVGGGHSWVWLCAGGLLRLVHAGVWCGL